MNLLDLVKIKDIKRFVKSTEWYHSSVALEAANKFDSVQYNIIWSKQKPRNTHPWDWKNSLFIKSGSSSGLGFGFSDDSMTGKFRTNRRKGTSQPKDRLSDHLVIMDQGEEANQIKKNIGNLANAWAPVFEKHGYGPKLLKNVWVNFIVPQTGIDFVESSMACEFLELITISNHKKTFNGSAPLADLKYQSRSDREMRHLIKDKRIESKKRITRFNNDDNYLNAKTNNNQNFNQVSADLEPFLTKKIKKVS
jgi:hypothetical protein